MEYRSPAKVSGIVFDEDERNLIARTLGDARPETLRKFIRLATRQVLEEWWEMEQGEGVPEVGQTT